MNYPISSSFDNKFVIAFPILFQFEVYNIGYIKLPKLFTKHHFVEGINLARIGPIDFIISKWSCQGFA
jgi:hypothetical protein